jgi:3-phosphoshikimate 1-carboxyvinyltransferase
VIDARIRPPGSKSITNRALVIAALARGTTTLRGALFSDDSRHVTRALASLGLAVEANEVASTLTVTGCDGDVPAGPATLFVGNAGTAARFLPPMLALGQGPYRLEGAPRMSERPLGPLVAALRSLGARIDGDAVPLTISGGRGARAVRVTGNLSSQFLSGLLLAAPCRPEGLAVTVDGPLVSRPYVDMTIALMRRFGAAVTEDGATIAVDPGGYRALDVAVEPDASAASYWFAAAAICGGRVTVPGLGASSLQGDLAFVRILEEMGCSVSIGSTDTTVAGPADGVLRGVEVDMREISDTAQTLAAIAPFASTPTRVTGIGFIRAKETDRIGAVVTELRRLGIDAVEEADGLVVRPGTPVAADVHTYDDHRMAMSFSILGLRTPGVTILDPGCVSKTYPTFFDDLDQFVPRS